MQSSTVDPAKAVPANRSLEPQPASAELLQISLVIPAYNEEDGILSTVAEAKAVLGGMAELGAWEIVVVDDGSADRTAEVLAGIEGVRVVRHPHNGGYGRALKSGMTAARYDTVVMTDADLTYPLDELPHMLALYKKGFDLVVGARTGREYRQTVIKAPLRSVLRWLVEYTTGRQILDINSGFRVLNKNTVANYFPHLCDTFSFTTSMTLSYMMTGRFVAYHPIPYRERIGKTKVRMLRDSLRTLQYIAQATVYYNPLKIFVLMAAIALVGSAVGFLISIFFGLLIGYILGLAGILLAFLMFSFGLMTVVLKQIMDK